MGVLWECCGSAVGGGGGSGDDGKELCVGGGGCSKMETHYIRIERRECWLQALVETEELAD